jgi:hypothetical protein
MDDLREVSDTMTNGGQSAILSEAPYMATIKIRGTADLLMHRWNSDAVEAKAKAAKNSTAKKTDDIESYVYRDDKGFICVKGAAFRKSIIESAKYAQDPRSPRKSAMDLFSAAVVSLTPLASLGTKKWDYEDRQRVVVQRSGVTRTRPAMRAGWTCQFEFLITLPEYVGVDFLHEVVNRAGRIGGIGDFRPTYGRFSVINFTTSTAT